MGGQQKWFLTGFPFKSASFLPPLADRCISLVVQFWFSTLPHFQSKDIPCGVITKSLIYSLHPWQEGVALSLLKTVNTTTLSTYSGQKTKESLKATIAAVLHADSRLYVQLGQFALLVDICAWRTAAHMSLTGRKPGRQVPALRWKTPADTILVPVAQFCFCFDSSLRITNQKGKSDICTH